MRKRIGLLSGCALALLSLVVFLIEQPVTPVGASTPSITWVVHSAYGIQVSIPRSWKVTYFSPCPRSDTLDVGAADYLARCPMFDSSGPWLGIYSTSPEQPRTGVPYPAFTAPPGYHFTTLTVRGLRVVRPPSSPLTVAWLVPSKDAVIIGSGPKALALVHTLAPATRRAIPALGIVTGKEYLEDVTQVPVSGSVTLTALKSHKALTLDAYGGGWGATVTPGHYAAAGHDGNAVCPAVEFTVQSGLRVAAPTIRCEGT